MSSRLSFHSAPLLPSEDKENQGGGSAFVTPSAGGKSASRLGALGSALGSLPMAMREAAPPPEDGASDVNSALLLGLADLRDEVAELRAQMAHNAGGGTGGASLWI